MDEGTVKIISPMKGSPAEQAGIKAGDFITHLDGKLIYGQTLDDAVAQMRGPAGTDAAPDRVPRRAARSRSTSP